MTQNINLLEEISIQPISAFNSKLMVQVAMVWMLLLILIYLLTLGVYLNNQKISLHLETVQNKLLTTIKNRDQAVSTHDETPTLKDFPCGSGSMGGFYKYLEDLAKFTPDEVWLNSMVFSVADDAITIQGSSTAAVGVSMLLNALNKSSTFHSRKFNTLLLEKDSESSRTDFTISTIAAKPQEPSKKT